MVQFVRTGGAPIYVQIRESLRADITQGVLKRGEQLPSEKELAARFKVSRMTVRESVQDLVDEGLLYRRHGVGTFVGFPHIQRDYTRLTSFFDRAESESMDVETRLLSLEVVPVTPKVAEALDLPAEGRVIRVKTLRSVEGLPITFQDAHIPQELFPNLAKENLEIEQLWPLFEKAGYRVKRAVQRVEAREASPEVARLMDMKEGAPVLFKERTVYADDGTPVEFTYCYNRSDIYSLTLMLER